MTNEELSKTLLNLVDAIEVAASRLRKEPSNIMTKDELIKILQDLPNLPVWVRSDHCDGNKLDSVRVMGGENSEFPPEIQLSGGWGEDD